MLSIKNLHIHYPVRNHRLLAKPEMTAAVRGVTFKVNHGETFAIVGESGSGKTSVMMSILGFVKPKSGRITFKETNIWKLTTQEQGDLRRKIQPVFQNSHDSLNPRMTAGQAVEDGLWTRKFKNKKSKRKEVQKLFFSVGLKKEHLFCYPFELSGGQKQRVCLARALAPSPELLILDEPLSAQDLSIQAHLINLLFDLKQQKNLTYLLITHDLRVVRSLAQRIAVMKDGKILELSNTKSIFNNPQHPYTRILLNSSGLV